MSTISLTKPSVSTATALGKRIAALPADARDLARELRKIDRSARLQSDALWTEISDKTAERTDLQRSRGGANDAEIADLQETLRADIAELQAEHAAIVGSAHVWPHVSKWLMRNRVPVIARDVRFPKSTTLKSVRADIDQVGAEIRSVTSAAISAADVKTAVMADVDALVESGTPNLKSAFQMRQISDLSAPDGMRRPGKIEWSREFPELAYDSIKEKRGADFVFSGLSTLAWLFEKELRAKLNAMIDAAAPKSGLSSAQRTTKLVELNAKLVELQYIEGSLIRASGDLSGFQSRMYVPCILGIEPAEGDVTPAFLANPRDRDS